MEKEGLLSLEVRHAQTKRTNQPNNKNNTRPQQPATASNSAPQQTTNNQPTVRVATVTTMHSVAMPQPIQLSIEVAAQYAQ